MDFSPVVTVTVDNWDSIVNDQNVALIGEPYDVAAGNLELTIAWISATKQAGITYLLADEPSLSGVHLHGLRKGAPALADSVFVGWLRRQGSGQPWNEFVVLDVLRLLGHDLHHLSWLERRPYVDDYLDDANDRDELPIGWRRPHVYVGLDKAHRRFGEYAVWISLRVDRPPFWLVAQRHVPIEP